MIRLSYSKEHEEEADHFARCLLMPQDSFVMFWKDLEKCRTPLPKILFTISEIFVCPVEQVTKRAKELELISEFAYNNLVFVGDILETDYDSYTVYKRYALETFLKVISIIFILTMLLLS